MKLSAIGRLAFVGVLLLLFSLSTHAALVAVDIDGDGRPFEGVYDTELGITWLADANYAYTSGFVTNTNGQMTWQGAKSFVDNVNSGAGLFGITDWRLPTLAPVNGTTFTNIPTTFDGSTDQGYQISAPVDPNYNPYGQSERFTGNELAYHYSNNFSAIGACSGEGSRNDGCVDESVYGIDDARNRTNLAKFKNIVRDSTYWTGRRVYSNDAYDFNFFNGLQRTTNFGVERYVWLVADGNVAASTVPVPAAAWLFVSGLLGLVAVRWRYFFNSNS